MARDKQFYTYLHCKPDGTPFYVGKGSGNRARDFYKRNKFHTNILTKYGIDNIKVYIFPCDSESQAFSDEIAQIAQFKSEGYTLVNISIGGEGASGVPRSEESKHKAASRMIGNKIRLGAVLSEETKLKISLKAIGRKYSAERNAKLSESRKGRPSPATGMRHSEESKRKISNSCRGLKRTTEQSMAQSIRQKGVPHPRGKGICPNCNKEVDLCHLKRWHLDKCKYK